METNLSSIRTGKPGGKFVASYSGGKDSVLAIYRAVQQGMIPLKAIITYNVEKEKSWFHGIPEEVLKDVSESFGFPIDLIRTSGDGYTESFESALETAKEQGAEYCVFGDIDIDEHLEWCSQRCEKVGIKPLFPLWKESRKDLVHEFMEKGFHTIIHVVDTSRLSSSFLGEMLCPEVTSAIEENGADICGENGEYHTFTYDGPLFKRPVSFHKGEIVNLDPYAVLPILP